MEFFGDKRWLVYVLPGFLALFIASFISDLPKISDAQLPITYIALTFLSVAIPLGVAHLSLRLRNKSLSLNEVIRWPSVIVSTFALSLIFGFLFGIFNNTDWVSIGLRGVFGDDNVLTLTHTEPLRYLFKNSQSPVLAGRDWIYYVNPEIKKSDGRYMRFDFGSDREMYEGVVTLYYASGDKPQAFLSPVCIIKNSQVTPYIGTGIWLSLENLRSVQVLYKECSSCQLEIDKKFKGKQAVCDNKFLTGQATTP